MVHLSHLMSQYLYILTKIHYLFRYPLVLSNVIFLFQDPILNNTLHLVVLSPLGVTVS